LYDLKILADDLGERFSSDYNVMSNSGRGLIKGIFMKFIIMVLLNRRSPQNIGWWMKSGRRVYSKIMDLNSL